MKARSPRGLYAAVFATGGLFAWVWLIKLMSDINEMAGRQIFATRLYGVVFALLAIGYFALFAMIPHSDPEIPGLSYDPSLLIGLAIVLTLSPPFFLVLISRHIDFAAGRSRALGADFKVFFLALFMCIGFPMVQQNMNDLIAARGGRT